MMIIDGQCERCRHYRGDSTCAAFPEGIPPEISVGSMAEQFDHRRPHPGDNEIRFEPLPGKRHPLAVLDSAKA